MQVPGIFLKPADNLLAATSLQPGQVVQVEVLGVENGLATVRIGGQTFTATGEIPSPPATFRALVREVTVNTVHLQYLSGIPEGDALTTMAGALGLATEPETTKLLQEMIRWQLPLERSLVEMLLSAARELPPRERAAFRAARVWLETLDLRADPVRVREALAYLLGKDEATPRGQEVLNQAVPLSPDQEMVSFFTFRGKGLHGELYLVDNRAGKKGEQDFPLALVVRVETPVLGATWVYLSGSGKELAARVTVAEEKFVPPFARAAGELKDRLAALGYTLGDIQVTARKISCICELLRPGEPQPYRPVNTLV
ncbi:hypothetical protein SAMN02745218_01600 [Desulfofundulus australicus DSM 11792]|uniref:Flagellar hook-length control protein FliK n=1 Tax=Desulfofundulus australicus DSM 11792 TaxID=1121425 RepID=A0A1M4ZE39_9FIRM|nr:flagellar hook-length control protein FliK [Desulfofundulus australicus]SHF16323.1 hypothetical protein SAMN02745218_01600 [Desulfofundulus australicus DSM 11792]